MSPRGVHGPPLWGVHKGSVDSLKGGVRGFFWGAFSMAFLGPLGVVLGPSWCPLGAPKMLLRGIRGDSESFKKLLALLFVLSPPASLSSTSSSSS
eukprot:1170734-Pyramimonas_sp.AAC.1